MILNWRGCQNQEIEVASKVTKVDTQGGHFKTIWGPQIVKNALRKGTQKRDEKKFREDAKTCPK